MLGDTSGVSGYPHSERCARRMRPASQMALRGDVADPRLAAEVAGRTEIWGGGGDAISPLIRAQCPSTIDTSPVVHTVITMQAALCSAPTAVVSTRAVAPKAVRWVPSAPPLELLLPRGGTQTLLPSLSLSGIPRRLPSEPRRVPVMDAFAPTHPQPPFLPVAVTPRCTSRHAYAVLWKPRHRFQGIRGKIGRGKDLSLVVPPHTPVISFCPDFAAPFAPRDSLLGSGGLTVRSTPASTKNDQLKSTISSYRSSAGPGGGLPRHRVGPDT